MTENANAPARALTLEQKVAVALDDLPAAGLPPLVYADGPNGVRGVAGATAFPSGLAVAASFDRRLARSFGRALARECLAAGRNAMLAPGLDIARVPWGGRVAEALGEDPLLVGEAGGNIAAGLQEGGVMAIAKHFVANNFEAGRTGRGSRERRTAAIDVRISPRALREIYAEPFRRVLSHYGGAGLLSSYNRIAGEYVSESADILRLPRREWGWKGLIVPDAVFAVRDDEKALLAGLDLPALGGPAERTREMVEAAPSELIDSISEHVAWAIDAVGLSTPGESLEPLRDEASQDLAQAILESGAVLLKNEGLLPLDRETVQHVALPGIRDVAHLLVMAGSAAVTLTPERISSLHDALDAAGVRQVTVVPGTLGDVSLPTLACQATARVTDDITGSTATIALTEFGLADVPEGVGADWSASLATSFTPSVTGEHRFALEFAGQATLRVDGVDVVSGAREASPFVQGPEYPLQATVDLQEGGPVALEVAYETGPAITIPPMNVRPHVRLGVLAPDSAIWDAAAASRMADVAVVVVGRVTGEGMDAESLRLPGDQERLIAAVAQANPRTIVVTCGSGPIVMPWAHHAAAILHVWNPGERFGPALARILFGDAEPGGRLPLTYPASEERTPVSSVDRFPGVGGVVSYDEELLVGYRWYDAAGEKPAFPFGHGLGYTDFDVTDFSATLSGDTATVVVEICNQGGRTGKVVPQIYSTSPPAAAHPPLSLRAFDSEVMDAGERRSFTFSIPVDDLADYDDSGRRVHPGEYVFSAGFSSRDLRRTASITIPSS